jgi:processive 1,2-diacylglycerol beta-glucosyltransferase
MKLLILSSDTGEGHNSAATAIQAAAASAGIQVPIRKPLEESGTSNRSLGNFYNFLLTRRPQWMTAYLWLIDRIRPNERDFLYSRVRPFIGHFLDSENPDVILSVHPMLNHFIPRFVKEERLGIACETFVTDPFPPFWRGWASPYIDRYFVVRDEARRELTRMNVDAGRIEVVPMPVRSQFTPATPADILRLRHELGFDGSSMILINGGARGGGPIRRIYETVRRAEPSLNVVVVCGRNIALRDQIQASNDPRTRAVGFVSDIHRYIAAADIVLTKPGAMSTYETLSCGVPVVLLGILALMPQESGMFEAAARYNFGFSALTFTQLENIVRLGPREWSRKREALTNFYRHSSGQELIERILPAHVRA